MFLLYIIDISNNLTYHIRLFAHDCIISRNISSPEDSLHLQEDLDRIFNWTTWMKIQFNVQKYIILWCTWSQSFSWNLKCCYKWTYSWTKTLIHISWSNMVLLNYNFTFTRVSTHGTTRALHGKCQKLPWKASFPCDGPWLFHAKTRGISRHVAFPRDDTWHFHETSCGISSTPVAVEFPRDQ